MTCIVGLISEKAVYIGGDSAVVQGDCVQPIRNPKVFVRDGLVFGYTTSFRMGQLIQYELDIPERSNRQTGFSGEGNSEENARTWLVKQFVPVLRECLSEHGFMRVWSDQEHGGAFLVGMEGQLFQVRSDFSVIEKASDFCAVGSGSHFAIGAMESMRSKTREVMRSACAQAGHKQFRKVVREEMTPEKQIQAALEATGRHAAGVEAPYHVVSTDSNNAKVL